MFFFPTKLKTLAYGEEKKRVPWTHISHPSKRLFSLPTPIFTSHSHPALTSWERRGSQIPISRSQDAALVHIVEIWLLQDSFRPYMGKLGTLSSFTELVRRAHLKWFWVSGPVPIWWHLRCTNTANQRSSTKEICFQDSSCVLSYPVSSSDPLPKTGVGQHLV